MDEKSELNIFFASLTRSSSQRELPISLPFAFKNVFKIPPPRIMKSHFANSFCITMSLVDTLAPEIIIVIGLESSFISWFIV